MSSKTTLALCPRPQHAAPQAQTFSSPLPKTCANLRT